MTALAASARPAAGRRLSIVPGVQTGRRIRWTPQRDAVLTDLWQAGACGKTIARMMGDGLTASAVRTRAARLGLACCPVRAAVIAAIRAEARAAHARNEKRATKARTVERLARHAAQRRTIWDMAATGAPLAKIAALAKVDPRRAAAFLNMGCPPGAVAHHVKMEHFAGALRVRAARIGLVDMMNQAAARWGVPATAIFGRNARECLRAPAVVRARTEIAVRLRVECGMSLLACEAMLRVNQASIMGALRRFEAREEFAALRAELAGGARP